MTHIAIAPYRDAAASDESEEPLAASDPEDPDAAVAEARKVLGG